MSLVLHLKKKIKKIMFSYQHLYQLKKIFTLVRCLVLANKENYFFKESVLGISDLIYSFFLSTEKKNLIKNDIPNLKILI